MTALAELQYYAEHETIAIRGRLFVQLENEIDRLRSMASINERLIEFALDVDTRPAEGERTIHVGLSLDLIDELRFAASDIDRRARVVAEKINFLSSGAFDAKG